MLSLAPVPAPAPVPDREREGERERERVEGRRRPRRGTELASTSGRRRKPPWDITRRARGLPRDRNAIAARTRRRVGKPAVRVGPAAARTPSRRRVGRRGNGLGLRSHPGSADPCASRRKAGSRARPGLSAAPGGAAPPVSPVQAFRQQLPPPRLAHPARDLRHAAARLASAASRRLRRRIEGASPDALEVS